MDAKKELLREQMKYISGIMDGIGWISIPEIVEKLKDSEIVGFNFATTINQMIDDRSLIYKSGLYCLSTNKIKGEI